MWDRRVVEKVEEAVRIYLCRVSSVFTGVYGPYQDSERGSFWVELGGLVNWWDAPW